MSKTKKFERKYTYKHIVVILLLFAIAASVNLVSRSQTLSSPCKANPKISQSVKKTERGWPLTYATKLEPKSICLVFKDGKLSELPATKSELKVWAVIANELIIITGILAILYVVSFVARKRVKHE